MRQLLLQSVIGAVLAISCLPASAGVFDKSQPVPQWGLDAYKTKVPDYAKGSGSVILFDEYVESIDSSGRAVERER
jgi:hypothetical protein